MLVVIDDELMRKNIIRVSQWFRSQSPVFCAKGILSLNTCRRNFMIMQDNYMENYVIYSFPMRNFIWKKSWKLSKYVLCILTFFSAHIEENSSQKISHYVCFQDKYLGLCDVNSRERWTTLNLIVWKCRSDLYYLLFNAYGFRASSFSTRHDLSSYFSKFPSKCLFLLKF